MVPRFWRTARSPGRLGHKFAALDMTPRLMDTATRYLRGSSRTDRRTGWADFLRKLRWRLEDRGSLTEAPAAGALNA
jgi:hypothetical protein